MGTRGLIGLIIAGKRYAAYNQFDSYPDGLGRDVVKFILSLTPKQWDEMAASLMEIEWVDEGGPVEAELMGKYMALEYHLTEYDKMSNRSHVPPPVDWHGMLRGIQGIRTLVEVQTGNLKHVGESMDFHRDGLFCEWAYFVDFEKRTLASYQSTELIDTVSFDDLKDLGDRYMERLVKMCADEEEDVYYESGQVGVEADREEDEVNKDDTKATNKY